MGEVVITKVELKKLFAKLDENANMTFCEPLVQYFLEL